MRGKYVPPSISLTAFNCPHCGALAKQFWHAVYSSQKEKDNVPVIWTQESIGELDLSEHEKEARDKINARLTRLARGVPFLEENHSYKSNDVRNLSISQCFNCNEISIWLYNRLLWPEANEAPDPNPDLPNDVLADYNEAGLVLNSSPRAAAALLRQAVQRLCKHAGEKGKNIDTDIASLVGKGLDLKIQRALDIVRVIGNNAVHPGQIDLKDDRATAEKLFDLVNLIADAIISQPKHIDDMYERLPEGARQAIEKRDAPKMIEDKNPAK